MSFRFKQFVVEDDQSSMRIGTDAVLLGAWVNPENRSEILDIGTGCGVIALMMAQKSTGAITAIDIDGDSVNQASLNFQNSSWNRRLKAFHCSFREFANHHPHKFDLVITNPPWFSNSLRSPLKNRNIARHDDYLKASDLLTGVISILSSNGKFCLILPAEDAATFIDHAKAHHLFLTRQLLVISKPGFPPKRIAMEFSLSPPGNICNEELIIRREDNSFTEDYRELTKDFYIEF